MTMRPTQRLTAQHGALLVVDLQDKLLGLIPDRDAVVAQTVALIRGARTLGMPVWATEQYPQGLGPSAAAIAELIPDRPAKTTFHCCGVPQLLEQLYGRNIRHVTVAGIEAHVCVAQTALELLDLGFRVQVPADAVASRHQDRLGVRSPPARTRRGHRVHHRVRPLRMDRTVRPTRVQGDQRADQVSMAVASR